MIDVSAGHSKDDAASCESLSSQGTCTWVYAQHVVLGMHPPTAFQFPSPTSLPVAAISKNQKKEKIDPSHEDASRIAEKEASSR
eukprot:195174-Rhodomonas_salina.2